MNPVLTEGYGQPYPLGGLNRTRNVSVVDPGIPVITGSIINERELSHHVPQQWNEGYHR